jgi:hypothetical protein
LEEGAVSTIDPHVRERLHRYVSLPSVTWLAAAASDVAHAYPSRGRHDAVCGAKWFDPMFAYPGQGRCPACVEAIG